VKIAYLSYAVANSYDEPMLAAAKSVATKAGNVSITVFDANNSQATQLNQLQTAASSQQYNVIIVQPIFGTGLITSVQAAIKSGVKVVNLDQTMGPDLTTAEPQVAGLSGNVVKVPSADGTHMGQLVVMACKAKNLNPCNVGFLGNLAGSSLDVAVRAAFDAAIKADPTVKVVSTGYAQFTSAGGLKATQTMLQADPSINLLVGSDQAIEGATQTVDPKKIVLVGWGGSSTGLKDTASGLWFGTVANVPASEGLIATQCAIDAIREGTNCGGINPALNLPDQGIITQSNVAKFTAQFVG
jgi:ribose transport system substrate-binding protein